MTANPCNLSIYEQVCAIAQSRLSAISLSQSVRDRIIRLEPRLHAWVELTTDIEHQANRIETASAPMPLRGVSVGVKDLVDVASPTTDPGQVTVSDARCVARLRELGAVIQGKTVTAEYGHNSTISPRLEQDRRRELSSGSATAVSANVVPVAIGTQTSAALTRPASSSGSAAMVLAHGEADLDGVERLSESLDSLGFFTRTVDDLRHVYRAFSGPAVPTRRPTVSSALVWRGSGLGELSTASSRLLDRLPGLLEEIDIDCRPLQWDDHVHSLAEDHRVVLAYELARNRPAPEFRRHHHPLSPPLRTHYRRGLRLDSGDHHGALVRRDRSRVMLEELLGRDALIVGPATLRSDRRCPASSGASTPSDPWQLLGLAAVVVPGVRTVAGLPVGIQIVGLPGRELDMLDLGVALEEVFRRMDPIPDH
ncbi:amidase family protein [Mycobacterium kyogaense]|uniref:amidase family protein n=1 Tax=Mycobacterium kyogaense TaxID=2212479 RepID=UPI000DAEDABB|nr:amidase family protein [Mycobacterium kyogaense]